MVISNNKIKMVDYSELVLNGMVFRFDEELESQNQQLAMFDLSRSRWMI